MHFVYAFHFGISVNFFPVKITLHIYNTHIDCSAFFPCNNIVKIYCSFLTLISTVSFINLTDICQWQDRHEDIPVHSTPYHPNILYAIVMDIVNLGTIIYGHSNGLFTLTTPNVGGINPDTEDRWMVIKDQLFRQYFHQRYLYLLCILLIAFSWWRFERKLFIVQYIVKSV